MAKVRAGGKKKKWWDPELWPSTVEGFQSVEVDEGSKFNQSRTGIADREGVGVGVEGGGTGGSIPWCVWKSPGIFMGDGGGGRRDL